jgi:transcription initiation factor TFIID subunit 12
VIQPAQIQQLAKQCNLEIQEARRLGIETPAGQEHLKKAQTIKTILMQYQQQQQQRNQQQGPSQQQGQSPQLAQAQVQNHQQSTASPQVQQSPQLVQRSPQMNQGQQQRPTGQSNLAVQQQQPQQSAQIQGIGSNVQNRGVAASPSPLTQGAPTPAPVNNNSPNSQAARNPYQQLQQLKQVLANFQKKLKHIETLKVKPNIPADDMQKLLQQEALLKDRFKTYKNAAVSLTQQIQKLQQQQQLQQPQVVNGQARSQSGTNPPVAVQQNMMNVPIPQQSASSNVGIAATPILQQQIQGAQLQNNNFQFQPQVQQQAVSQAQFAQQLNQVSNNGSSVIAGQQAQKQALSQRAQNVPKPPPQQQQQQQQQQKLSQPSRTGTPISQNNVPATRPTSAGATSASPNAPVTNVNAAAKPNGNTMGSMSTPAANVFKSSVPSLPISNQITPKPVQAVQVQQVKPSLTGGQGLAAPALTTPAIMKLPPYEMQSDRVLSKRKLSELVKTVGADEGDGETTIDGDVEELLLDLADEFVTNVTSFACRLAKHRKSDTLDPKDIQLHLEKNWNIRIPGYSSDEIRNVRKWQPSTAHAQRILGIGISKSVEQNK